MGFCSAGHICSFNKQCIRQNYLYSAYLFCIYLAYYLLLEDCLQKKTFAGLRNPVYRGELLHVSETEEWYVHDTNPRLYVNCSRDQVKHVHYVYPQFLLAITDLNSRYNLFNNKLELLSSIALHTIGDEMEVRLENEDIPVAATISYIGMSNHISFIQLV